MKKANGKTNSRVMAELDIIKTELTTLTEGRKEDCARAIGLEKQLKSISEDVIANSDTTTALKENVERLDNGVNKNMERILRMEERFNKLEDDHK